MRKKILLCITKSAAGGAQKYVYDLATHLPAEQFEPIIVAGGSGPLFAMAKKKDIRTISVSGLERDANPAKDLRAFFYLVRIFIKEKPNIIHLNSSKMGTIGALAALTAKCITGHFKPRVIFTIHGWGFREDRNILSRMAIFTASWIAARFHHHTIAINSADYRDARAFIPHTNISLIPLGIDQIAFLERKSAQTFFSKQFNIPPHTFLVGVTAELIKNKGIQYLLHALHINTKSPNPMRIHAVVMGEGKERANLEKQIREFGLENDASLIGFVPDANIYLKAFDAFVLPSVKEGLPYAVMEAMAAGVPVIATNTGGIPDLITHEITGMITAAKKSDILNNHLNTLYTSQEMRERMGKQAKKTIINEFPLDRMITKTANLYHELTQPHQ